MVPMRGRDRYPILQSNFALKGHAMSEHQLELSSFVSGNWLNMKTLMMSFVIAALGASQLSAEEYLLHSFTKHRLTDQFWSEGAHVGDFNHDGKMDVVSGPFWYAGPDFKERQEIYPATKTFKLKKDDGSEVEIPGYEGSLGKNNDYSNNFLTYTHDLNGDGWTDVLVYGFPGKEATWYENPKGKKGHWTPHVAVDVLDNESPMWADVNGDSKPDIVGGTTEKVDGKDRGFIAYATADWSAPEKPWTWHKISPPGDWQRFTHGIGVGDVNGDGKADFLLAEGWWEQPASLAGDPVWKFHPAAFGFGGAQMYAYDVNGDGLNDVITSRRAHDFGLAWYEQVRDGSEIKFKQHLVMGSNPSENKYGLKFSQLHAIDLVDMDRDGLKDIVTGKRFWAHGPKGDAEPEAPAVVYWFKLVRNADKSVEWIPQFVDDDSGVGTEVIATDVNGDSWPDIVVGNKKGTFVHLHEVKKVSKEEWQKAQPKAVTPAVSQK